MFPGEAIEVMERCDSRPMRRAFRDMGHGEHAGAGVTMTRDGALGSPGARRRRSPIADSALQLADIYHGAVAPNEEGQSSSRAGRSRD